MIKKGRRESTIKKEGRNRQKEVEGVLSDEEEGLIEGEGRGVGKKRKEKEKEKGKKGRARASRGTPFILEGRRR